MICWRRRSIFVRAIICICSCIWGTWTCKLTSVIVEGALIGPSPCVSTDVDADASTEEGYSDLATLRSDLLSIVIDMDTDINIDAAFVICPNTTFTFNVKENEDHQNSTLVISGGSTRILCGMNGSRTNQCNFIGKGSSNSLIMITNTRTDNGNKSPANVHIEGLTFSGSSTRASVVIATESGSTVTFSDCAWQHINGTAAFLTTPLTEPGNNTTVLPSTTPTTLTTLTPTALYQLVRITIQITFDGFPEETYWNLYCEGSLINQTNQGDYAGKPFQLIIETQYVPGGNECIFTIFDQFGDGICCSQGSGKYEVFNGDTADPSNLLFGGATFTASEVNLFTVPSSQQVGLRTVDDNPIGLDDDDDYASAHPSSTSLPSSVEPVPGPASPTDSTPVTPFPTVTYFPTRTYFPTLTFYPTTTVYPTSTPFPTLTDQPTITPTFSSKPSTVTSSPSNSASPSLQPSVTPNPSLSSAPTTADSSAPSTSSSPSHSTHPSISPTITSSPFLSSAPTATDSSIPSTTSSPTNSVHPSALPTVTMNPSLSITPTATESSIPSTSSSPTNSIHPSMAPSVTSIPSLSSAPPATVSSAPSTSSSPTDSARPSMAPTITSVPSFSSAPAVAESSIPTITGSPSLTSGPSTGEEFICSSTTPCDADYFCNYDMVVSGLCKSCFECNGSSQECGLSTEATTDFLSACGAFPPTVSPIPSTIIIEQCFFEENEVSSVIFHSEGNLIVEETEFKSNTAIETIILLLTGQLSVSNTTFLNNTVTNLPGVVFLENDATLELNENNCGANIVANQECQDIHMATGSFLNTGGLCNLFGAGYCLTPSMPPSYSSNEGCFSEWNVLSDAVASADVFSTLIVCPNSTFDLSTSNEISPIVIRTSELVIQCGESGERSNQCLVLGGSDQFVIEGSVTGIIFEGLTFIGSSHSSINAAGQTNAKAAFIDCEFAGHTGLAAVLNYRPPPIEEDIALETIEIQVNEGLQRAELYEVLPSQNGSMTIDFLSCTFSNNLVAYAAVSNFGGNIEVNNSVFIGNTGESGAISSLEGGLTVTKSCFMQNSGKSSGSILVQNGLVVADENFGAENVDDTGSCTDFLLDDTCVAFDSLECLSSVPFVIDLLPQSLGIGPCLFSAVVSGYSNQTTFLDDVANAVSDTFGLCPGSFLKETELRIGRETVNIKILCVDDRRGCIWNGGERHLTLKANPADPPEGQLNIVLEGITFRNATDASVVIEGIENTAFHVTFIACVWEDNTGDSTLVINQPRRQTEGRQLQSDTYSTDVTLLGCVFLGNTAEIAIAANYKGNLQVEECSFRKNNVTGSILAAIGGTITIKEGRFERNTFDESQGIVFVDNQAIINKTATSGACGLNNDASISPTRGLGCNGIFIAPDTYGPCSGANATSMECQGECFSFDECPVTCFSDYEILVDALKSANETGGVFEICPGTVFDLTEKNRAPLTIVSSNITLQCGDGSARDECTILGGRQQLAIIGSVSDVVVHGMILRGATEVSVSVEGISPFSVLFTECVWKDVDGSIAFLLEDTATPMDDIITSNITGSPTAGEIESDDAVTDLFDFLGARDDTGVQMHLRLYKCFFQGNTVTDAIIVNIGAVLEVNTCLFIENTAQQALILNENGRADIVSSCFLENEQGASHGLILGDQESQISTIGNYGASNSFVSDGLENSCEGIFTQNSACGSNECGGECTELDAASCAARDIAVTVSDIVIFSVPCLSDWTNLSEAVGNAPSGSIITVCAGSNLDANEQPESRIPIVIKQEDLTITCGEDGSRRGKCIISGGESHFRILNSLDNAGEIIFAGLTMVESRLVSIFASGGEGSRAVFNDCEWKNNNGLAAILVYNEQAGDTFLSDIESLQPPSAPSMSIEFTNCAFSANVVSFASVASIGGAVVFERTVFLENIISVRGVISATGAASISVSSCCFIRNQAALPGMISVEQGSSLMLNSDNFGRGNKVDNGTCADIFLESAGSNCAADRQADLSCDGSCSLFSSTLCAIPLEATFETPSGAPSATASPSTMTSKGAPSPEIFFDLTYANASFGSSGVFICTMTISILLVFGGIGGHFFLNRQASSHEGRRNSSSPLRRSCEEDNNGGWIENIRRRMRAMRGLDDEESLGGSSHSQRYDIPDEDENSIGRESERAYRFSIITGRQTPDIPDNGYRQSFIQSL